MTIHSAKGLEFPVTILWDGFQTFSDRAGGSWRVERDGRAWALGLGAVAIENRPGGRLLEREKHFGEEERKRMYYVAATRARDLLVIPEPLRKGSRDDMPQALIGEPESTWWRFEKFCLNHSRVGARHEVCHRRHRGRRDATLDARPTFSSSQRRRINTVPRCDGEGCRGAVGRGDRSRSRSSAQSRGSRFGPCSALPCTGARALAAAVDAQPQHAMARVGESG
jgi:hypothetical protein